MTFGDLIVIAVLALVVGLIIRGMIRDKKQGKTCGGCTGCSGCASCGSCTHCPGCSGKKQ